MNGNVNYLIKEKSKGLNNSYIKKTMLVDLVQCLAVRTGNSGVSCLYQNGLLVVPVHSRIILENFFISN